MYWAIVKRSGEEDQPGRIPTLLEVLMSFAIPLRSETIQDLRFACIELSDHALFQRLCFPSGHNALSERDAMLLGTTALRDRVTVDETSNEEGSFTVNFEIPKFQRRIQVSKKIEFEFIARGKFHVIIIRR